MTEPPSRAEASPVPAWPPPSPALARTKAELAAARAGLAGPVVALDPKLHATSRSPIRDGRKRSTDRRQNDLAAVSAVWYLP